jgi:hypothetical protein
VIALLQKDFRLFRAPLITAVVVIVAPYILAIAATMYDQIEYSRSNPVVIEDGFQMASSLGILGTILLAAIFAGCAFTIERRQRWADFLLMMPGRKLEVVLSKLTICFPVVFLAWLIHCSVLVCLEYYQHFNGSMHDISSPAQITDALFFCYLVPASALILVFGVAWLFSALIQSPSISASLGGLALLALAFTVQNLFPVLFFRDEAAEAFVAYAIPAGLIAFFAGTACYLNRVTP